MQPLTSFFLYLIIIFYTLPESNLSAHGLSESTLVKTWSGSKSIKSIADKISKNKKIVSYTFKKNRCTSGYVRSSGKSQSNCYISIGFDNPFGSAHAEDLSCTPAQEFYLPVKKKWIPACELKVGDILQSNSVGLIAITHIRLVDQPITVYSLEIDKHHNFFVGKYFVLTHNMVLPWTCSAGLSISFGGGAAAGGKAGSYFGPAGIVGGIVVGGILGWAIEKYANSDKVHLYESLFDVTQMGIYLTNNTPPIPNSTPQVPPGSSAPQPNSPKDPKNDHDSQSQKDLNIRDNEIRDPKNNKFYHILQASKHKLDRIGKTSDEVVDKIVNMTRKAIQQKNLPQSGKFVIRDFIDGHEVEIRGAIINNEIRYSTFFVDMNCC